MGLRFLSAEFQWKLLDALAVAYPNVLPIEIYNKHFRHEPEITVISNVQRLIDSNLICNEAIVVGASGVSLNISQLLLTDIGYFLSTSNYLLFLERCQFQTGGVYVNVRRSLNGPGGKNDFRQARASRGKKRN